MMCDFRADATGLHLRRSGRCRYVYLAGPIGAGELARSQLVLAGRGASVIIGLDHYGQPRGIEFLGITKLLTTEAIELLREGRSPFEDYS